MEAITPFAPARRGFVEIVNRRDYRSESRVRNPAPGGAWPQTDFFLLEGGTRLRRIGTRRSRKPFKIPGILPGRATRPPVPPPGPRLPRRQGGKKFLAFIGRAGAGIAALWKSPGRKPLLIAAASFLTLSVLLIGGLWLATPSFPLPTGGLRLDDKRAEDALLDFITPELATTPTETSLPPLPKSFVTESYTVRKGDSLGSIASRFGIAIDTVVSINGIQSARGLRIGTELKIPNMNGLIHVVGKGESLASIAKSLGSNVTTLADANNLGTDLLRPGQALFIPGAHLAPADLKRVFGEYVAWPVHGPISSYFGYRPDPFSGVKRFHGGIDIVVPAGTPVDSIMDGRVADVGYNQLFGNYLIVNHADGIQSLYGHLSAQLVRLGQYLRQGEEIGLSGNSGYSTAAHLHLGIYRGGSSVNPLKYLK